MAARLKLEVFDPEPSLAELPDAEAVSPEAVEDVRLAAYEKGYSAGWEDAVAAQSDDQVRIRDDLARNLRDLSFTYWEARAHLLGGLEPLLRGMVDRVLPEIARATLGAAVVAEIKAEAGRLASAPVSLEVSPANRAAVEAALGAEPALPVTLREEPSLADGQVHFRFGGEERALDLEALLGAIRALVADFLSASDASDERQVRHG
ncbi:MAG: flagellar biosynthesis protein [Paracoccaceae bacterium]|nr:flagellar biosynthesis protein [Paracoccaceae bacterium]